MQLRADIVTCRISPGEKLNISTISKRFDVSLAAVREALSRLMAAGLVVAEDQRGFRASPLSIPDLMDLTQTRIEIESLALRRAMRERRRRLARERDARLALAAGDPAHARA